MLPANVAMINPTFCGTAVLWNMALDRTDYCHVYRVEVLDKHHATAELVEVRFMMGSARGYQPVCPEYPFVGIKEIIECAGLLYAEKHGIEVSATYSV